MVSYYVSIMFRDEDGELQQESIDFLAKNKTQAKKQAKEIANKNKARMLGFWENK